MRIISGLYKGRKLKSPRKNAGIRPTTDRVRETLFNVLTNMVDFRESTFLDLFCGTGSFGIECLSRGALHVTFIDKDTRLVKENIPEMETEEKYTVFQSDALKYVKNAREGFDVAFADPPYRFREYPGLIRETGKICSLFILEHSSRDKFQDAQLRKDFGDTSLTFFNFTKK